MTKPADSYTNIQNSPCFANFEIRKRHIYKSVKLILTNNKNTIKLPVNKPQFPYIQIVQMINKLYIISIMSSHHCSLKVYYNLNILSIKFQRGIYYLIVKLNNLYRNIFKKSFNLLFCLELNVCQFISIFTIRLIKAIIYNNYLSMIS